MSLFNFGKKKQQEKKAPTCTCQRNCPSAEIDIDELEANSNLSNKNSSYSIKVLGPGCASCHELLENVKEAVKNMDIDVEIEYITDMQKIMLYGVMSVPALIINEKIISVGKVLKRKYIEDILKKMGF